MSSMSKQEYEAYIDFIGRNMYLAASQGPEMFAMCEEFHLAWMELADERFKQGEMK